MSELIDRQEAIDGVFATMPGATLNDVLKVLRELPTVQPEPQWGRFERKRDGVFCSVCHNGWEFITGVPVEVEREYRYCPYCGAKMTISK